MTHLALEGLAFSNDLRFMVRRLDGLKQAVLDNTPMNVRHELDRLTQYWALCRPGFEEKLALLEACLKEEEGCE